MMLHQDSFPTINLNGYEIILVKIKDNGLLEYALEFLL
jgi:hypothetical protein